MTGQIARKNGQDGGSLMTKPNILVVDDDTALQDLIREVLEEDGYVVFSASNGKEALRLLKVKKTDTILLDLMLPDVDGLGLISDIRQLTAAPIIVISGKGNWVDKVVGLEIGADDYLGKPFELRELAARVKASVRRYKDQAEPRKNPDFVQQPRIRFGALMLNGAKFQVFDAQDKSCELTAMEFRLLEALVKSPNCVISREQLLDKVHDENLNITDRAIDIQIARIRKKIGDNSKEPQIIKTVRGIGYML